MVVWLLYATTSGCLLGLAGLLAERGLRNLGRPVRLVWVVALALTVLLPLPALWSRLGGVLGGPTLDLLLVVGWAALSLVVMAALRLSGWTLRRNARSWSTREVDGERVDVSAGFGPGVVGIWRPRIVLPRWVVDSEAPLRRLVVLHELEHVRARDSRLLLAGLVLVALVPWCLPLWWQLHRLRMAVEMDCDGRVLAAMAAPRDYARALVAVAGRRTRDLSAVPALAPGAGELERRIRLITAGPAAGSRWGGAALLSGAAALAVAVGALPVPVPASPPVPEAEAPAADSPREAIIIFSIGSAAVAGDSRPVPH
jgi:bla regulator protein blaR1